MNRIFVLVVYAVIMASLSRFQDKTIGIERQLGLEHYQFTATLSPIVIILASILFALIIFYPQGQVEGNTTKSVGSIRRIVAFLIDILAILFIFKTFITIPVILYEYFQTGIFAFEFNRVFLREYDVIFDGLQSFAVVFFIVYYFYKHLVEHRQTIGQYITGYKIYYKGTENKLKMLLRVLLSYIFLCTWPIGIIIKVISKKNTLWYESMTSTYSMCVDIIPKTSINETTSKNT